MKERLLYRNVVLLFYAASQLFILFGLSSCQTTESLSGEESYRDLYSDTWVASDALDRKMPSFDEVGPVKQDQRRVVGIFYITWHSDNLANMKSPYNG